MLGQRIGFIGAGQMAEALMRGLIDAGLSSADRITASDAVADRLEYICSEVGVATTSSNSEVVKKSEIIILAVKPNIVPDVLEDILSHIGDGHLVVSIAAGVPLSRLQDGLPGSRIVRVMPNTPCLVREAAAGFALGEHATDEDRETVNQILSAVGRAFCLEEKLLDAVTGLSGSGPAYVFILIEAMADGGVRAGLPRDVAQTLAAQTVLGSAKMVLETGDHPGILKDRVASPGGTTIAGIHELEKGGFRDALMEAVVAAAKRSKELGEE